MADKREIQSRLRQVKKIKTWQLVILLVMVGFVAATFLRLNNVGMIERREAVYAADKAADDLQLEKRLYDLQRYVAAHMNADPGRVALHHKYQRDNDAKKAELEGQSDGNPQGNVYKKAAEVCDPIGQSQGWRWPDPRYTECVNQELAKYPAADQLKLAYTPIPTEAYYHTFVSPLWSPDFAGWSVVVFAVILLIIIIRLLILLTLKILIKYKYRTV